MHKPLVVRTLLADPDPAEADLTGRPAHRYSWNCAGDSVMGATSKSGSYQIACGEEECFILNIDNGVAKDLGIPFQVEVEVASKMSVVCDVKKMFFKKFTEELNL